MSFVFVFSKVGTEFMWTSNNESHLPSCNLDPESYRFIGLQTYGSLAVDVSFFQLSERGCTFVL